MMMIMEVILKKGGEEKTLKSKKKNIKKIKRIFEN